RPGRTAGSRRRSRRASRPLDRVLADWLAGSHPAQLVEAQAGASGHLLEPADGLELVAGDRLLGQVEVLGHVLVGPSLDDQELEAAEAVVIGPCQPLADELAQGLGQKPFLGLAALAAA